MKNTEGVLADPEPAVDVIELADSSVNLKMLYWTDSYQSSTRTTSDRVFTKAKLALDEAGIEIPFPHTVLTMASEKMPSSNGKKI